MATTFLSYRRDDSQATAGRIVEHLEKAFGRQSIFWDVDSIAAGANFSRTIEHALDKSNAVLVLIGRHWLTATNPDGTRRIDDTDDFVRLEIEQALRSGKMVIPVLVDNARMPAPSELPPSIRDLTNYQAVEIRPSRDFNSDMQRLIKTLEELTGELRARPAMAEPHQRAAMPLHLLIVSIFGLLALTSIGGGIYAIALGSTAQTTLIFLGAELRTEHVGVALVGIGIIAFLTVRSVLKSQHDLAKLPLDHKPRRPRRLKPNP